MKELEKRTGKEMQLTIEEIEEKRKEEEDKKFKTFISLDAFAETIGYCLCEGCDFYVEEFLVDPETGLCEMCRDDLKE